MGNFPFFLDAQKIINALGFSTIKRIFIDPVKEPTNFTEIDQLGMVNPYETGSGELPFLPRSQ
jgi:hypothetical protein